MPQLAICAIAISLILAPMTSRPGASQTSTALAGVVTDQMQGLVSGATIVLRDAQGAEKQKSRADRNGRYVLEAVPDGNVIRVDVVFES